MGGEERGGKVENEGKVENGGEGEGKGREGSPVPTHNSQIQGRRLEAYNHLPLSPNDIVNSKPPGADATTPRVHEAHGVPRHRSLAHYSLRTRRSVTASPSTGVVDDEKS